MLSKGDYMEEGMLTQVRRFKKDQKRFLHSQIIASTYNNMVTGVFMTGLLLQIGIKSSKIGIFLSIPLLANIIQMAMGNVWNCFQNYKKVMNRMVLFARLGILSIVFIPLATEIGFDTKVFMAGSILIVSYTMASSAGIRLNYWMVNSISVEKQGTFFAFRDRLVVGITLLISFCASYLIDYLKARKLEYVGFAVAFGIAAFLACTDYFILKRIEHKKSKEQQEKLQWSSYWKILKKDGRFLRFIIYMLFLNLAMNLANPYYNSYMLDNLGLKYIHVMVLTALQVCIQIAVSSIWGKIANKMRWRKILNITVFILGIQFCIWALVTRESLGIIYIIFISSGLISTGLVTGQFMAPYEFIRNNHHMAYLSLCTSVSALGGFAGSLLGSKIITIFQGKLYQFCGVEIGPMQVNMIVSGGALLGTAVYAKILLNNRMDK